MNIELRSLTTLQLWKMLIELEASFNALVFRMLTWYDCDIDIETTPFSRVYTSQDGDIKAMVSQLNEFIDQHRLVLEEYNRRKI